MSRTDTERVRLDRSSRRTVKEKLCRQRYQGVLSSMVIPAIVGTTVTKTMVLTHGVTPDCAVELAIRTNSRDVMEMGVIGSTAV